ncbi:amidohydrolase family protein [Penicillium maclennaniae]|uniref:amidohydrolase family protein n=1 Tax=Penicillium maclennaniae TaxID=1343394 RepID=UPI00253FBAC5|nr:amidohydrolase family protein [Penicillium maclennaniae]KAJ5677289.1 amidohydrolase family protein [Penicillium maclennaniae]
MTIPIVDSHIHLFPASHLPTLAWYTADSPLGAQHSVNEYRHAFSPLITSTTDKYLGGFIFLETDRISSINGNDPGRGWQYALDEVSFLSRIATGQPLPGEGHSPADKNLCLGIVPWAPVPGGRDVLMRYISMARERTGPNVWKKVCGVRYLVQDKPAGVMLEDNFVDALRWLGEQRIAFDLGVDARQGGLGQLREAVEMMRRVYDGVGEDGVTIVINHLCKPNLRIGADEIDTHKDFLGHFSELPPLERESEADVNDLVNHVKPWTDVVFDAFGPERVMFGSDWPVCNVGGGGNDISWSRWRKVVEGILDRRGLTEDQKRGVWGEVAIKAYGIEA